MRCGSDISNTDRSRYRPDPEGVPDVRSSTTTRSRFRSLVARLATAAVLAAAGGLVATVAPAHAASPYERGPAPTDAILEASRGPFATSSTNVSSLSVSGFGGGGMHGYNSLEGTFLGGCLFSGRTAGRAVAAAL